MPRFDRARGGPTAVEHKQSLSLYCVHQLPIRAASYGVTALFKVNKSGC